jgi:hypothetical protein
MSNLLMERISAGVKTGYFYSYLCIQYSTAHSRHKKTYSLKGQCHEIFASGFFHESIFPQTQSIPLGPFKIFSKIHGDICKSRCTTGISDTGGKFATGINNTWRQILPQVSLVLLIPVANLPQVSMTPVANNGNNIRLLRP